MRIEKDTVVSISYELSNLEGEVLEKSTFPVSYLHGGYGDATMSDPNLYANPALFRKAFPELDTIKKAYVLKK